MLENYDPQQFRPEFDAHGEDFEVFFSSILNQERGHVSVEVAKPAAMFLERPAIKFFGDARFANHRFRQAFGHVIRYVMVNCLGYELDQTEVRIPNGVYLTRGARYREATGARRLTA